MTKLYLVTQPAIPEQQFLVETLEPYYLLSFAENWDGLLQQLKDDEHLPGVVIFSETAQKLPLQVTQLKTVHRGIGMIQVMNHEDAQTLPGHQFEVDFLLPPLTRFEVLSRVSTALRHSETLSSLESSTQTDEVTQLYNRTYFLKRLAGEIALSKRHESPVCCVVLGINYYQVFLDSYGYEFINGLLKHLAVIIKSHIRQEDMVARVGDEELALLLPRSSEKGAQVMTERIIRSVLELPFEFEEQTEEITLHAGIAGYPMIEESDTQEADADALIRYARHALHNAKSSESRTIQCFGEIKPAFG